MLLKEIRQAARLLANNPVVTATSSALMMNRLGTFGTYHPGLRRPEPPSGRSAAARNCFLECGIDVGFLGNVGVSRLLAKALIGRGTANNAIVPVILILVTMAACYVPARRAFTN